MLNECILYMINIPKLFYCVELPINRQFNVQHESLNR